MECSMMKKASEFDSIVECMNLPDAFSREDEGEDAGFYAADRMVAHVDRVADATIRRVIGSLLTERQPAILDLMASWDSHLPDGLRPGRVTGLGMNERELQANKSLTDYVVHDLNRDPTLPFEDAAFDAVLNVVSVDYLTRPVEVFKEVQRVLKPGGLFLVIFSNRCFPKKAVKIWREAMEKERIELVEEFLRRAGGFDPPELFISMGKPRPADDKYAHLAVPSDPVFAVFADKTGGPARPRRAVPADRECALISDDEYKRLKGEIKRSMRCPHCGEKLAKWKVPDDPNFEWDTDYMFICMNDACPFLVRGWQHMFLQGIAGTSYRFVYIRERDCVITVPVHTLDDLKNGVVPGP